MDIFYAMEHMLAEHWGSKSNMSALCLFYFWLQFNLVRWFRFDNEYYMQSKMIYKYVVSNSLLIGINSILKEWKIIRN